MRQGLHKSERIAGMVLQHTPLELHMWVPSEKADAAEQERGVAVVPLGHMLLGILHRLHNLGAHKHQQERPARTQGRSEELSLLGGCPSCELAYRTCRSTMEQVLEETDGHHKETAGHHKETDGHHKVSPPERVAVIVERPFCGRKSEKK